MAHHGFHAVVNYLDDFLTRSTKEECQWGLVTRINLLHYLGFNASWRKVVSLTQRIIFLGIELDSSTMSPRLPEDKFNRLIDLVNTFSLKASASKCQLQSLAESLNFACQVVHGGRTFLHHMIDYLNKLNPSSHRCPLSTDFLLMQRDLWHLCRSMASSSSNILDGLEFYFITKKRGKFQPKIFIEKIKRFGGTVSSHFDRSTTHKLFPRGEDSLK